MQAAMTQYDANQQAAMNIMNNFAAEAGPIFLELGCEQKCVSRAMARAYRVDMAIAGTAECCDLNDYINIGFVEPVYDVSVESACFKNNENQVSCI